MSDRFHTLVAVIELERTRTVDSFKETAFRRYGDERVRFESDSDFIEYHLSRQKKACIVVLDTLLDVAYRMQKGMVE